MNTNVLWKSGKFASVRQSAFLSVIFMVGYLALGTAFFIRQTEWTIPSSLLFSIYTITTVGYGNHRIPKTPRFQLYVIFYILIGVESLYFSVVSLATVGFGDYFPTRTASIWFCIFWLPFLIGFMSLFLSNVAAFYIRLSDRNIQRIERQMKRR